MLQIIRSYYNNKHKSVNLGGINMGDQGWAPGQSDAVLGNLDHWR